MEDRIVLTGVRGKRNRKLFQFEMIKKNPGHGMVYNNVNVFDAINLYTQQLLK